MMFDLSLSESAGSRSLGATWGSGNLGVRKTWGAPKNQICKLVFDRSLNRRNLMHTAASVFRPIPAAGCGDI